MQTINSGKYGSQGRFTNRPAQAFPWGEVSRQSRNGCENGLPRQCAHWLAMTVENVGRQFAARYNKKSTLPQQGALGINSRK